MSKEKSKRPKVLPWSDLKSVGKARSYRGSQAQARVEEPKTSFNFPYFWISLGLLLGITLIAFMPALFGKFVDTDNYLIGSFQDAAADPNFWNELIANAFVAPLGEPWLKTGFATDFGTFRFDPFWYHFVNLGLHMLAVTYLYIFVLRLSRFLFRDADDERIPYRLAFITALLFAVHPMVSESVAYISGRAGVLTGCNFFLALNFFLLAYWSEDIIFAMFMHVAAVLAVIMAIGTSPAGMAIPFVIATLAFLLKSPQTHWLDWLDERGPETAVWVILSLGLPWLARLPFSLDFASNFAVGPVSQGVYLATQFKAFLCYYLRCAIFPVGLSASPPFAVASGWSDPGAVLGLVTFVAIVGCVYAYRNKIFVALPLAISTLGFLPFVLIQTRELASDTRFFIPLSGVCLLAGCDLARRVKTDTLKNWAVPAALIAVLVALTMVRSYEWQSNRGIWTAALRVSPDDPRSQGMLADATLREGDAAKAAELALPLRQRDKDDLLSLYVLAQSYLKNQDYQQAKKYFLEAEKLAEKEQIDGAEVTEIKRGLAEAMLSLKEYADAGQDLIDVVHKEPGSIKSNLLLGKALIGINQPTMALRYLNVGFKRDRLNAAYIEPIAQACLMTNIPMFVRNAYGAAQMGLKVAPTTNLVLLFSQAAIELHRNRDALAQLNQMVGEKNENHLEPDVKAKAVYLKSIALRQMADKAAADQALKVAEGIDPQISKKLKVTILTEAQLLDAHRGVQTMPDTTAPHVPNLVPNSVTPRDSP